MRDPIRDPRRLAEIEHAEAQPSHEVGCSWGIGQRCTCKAIRAERESMIRCGCGHPLYYHHVVDQGRGPCGVGDPPCGCQRFLPALAEPQPPAVQETPAGAIRNALQIIYGQRLRISDGPPYELDTEELKDSEAVVRLLKHALAQLEGSPLRAPQETREP